MKLTFLLLATSLICLALQFEPMQAYAAWNIHSIADGQWWRILTGNFTHTNFAHLGMNLAGLWVICYLFKPSAKTLLFALVILSLFVGVGNIFTDMTTYVGLSGALHGLFGYFALQEVLQGRKGSLLLVAGLIAKVLWEHLIGASESTSAMINAKVAIEAHLSGSLGGFALALLEHFHQQKKRPS
ncbi:rhombosortase [Vibrio paucivorans]|uniref:Rhombosortase n=1 Tax=Vibrio paucivorans TaxID=2829489 RepID=A0A9X3HSA6_9VIBR|nr:rhombosortase [Vibrio paucivorans]MCW8334663.1 rhombosortase [Vibrio paucivorans]